MIAPALGVPRRFYRAFAELLAEGGIATLIVDCRSTPGSRLLDWADHDLPAALAWLRARYPGLPIAWVGHSMGGQLFGLLRDAPVDRALLVAAQHGHWRNWRGWPRWAMAALWWAVIPGLTLTGRDLPMRLVGGEDVPATLARDWARLGRDREYVLGVARRRGPCAFDQYRGAVRSYAVLDDRYAPPTTVHPLAAAFRATPVELHEVDPAAYGLERLGHFGSFRPPAHALWLEWRQWLLAE